MSADHTSTLTVSSATVDQAVLLTAEGVLNARTYRSLRDEIIKTALDEPAAVLVDISALSVPAESALAVFTSAKWHVARWPQIPIALICGSLAGRRAVARNGVSRYVPVYPTAGEAMAAVPSFADRHRRRARANLPADPSSLSRSRRLVEEWLSAWSKNELVPVAKVVVTTLVENVLQHTDSAPSVRLETRGETVTVAVEDDSRKPPIISETQLATDQPTGLKLIDALTRAWGNAPTPSGKTVWAVIGPENRL
ncbi:sulfate transporter [Mycolicibacterium agri]|uniref:Sulfate transporter n=1 Tax=Mycolicibacterium agri TaxID=36811 RepID=A0A2A7N8P7_MYCAG|nr:sulfate transporter [Mycolicibacterium agri]GFG55768.1 sulfate transporter [Mycolicibacterium agri]